MAIYRVEINTQSSIIYSYQHHKNICELAKSLNSRKGKSDTVVNVALVSSYNFDTNAQDETIYPVHILDSEYESQLFIESFEARLIQAHKERNIV